MIQYYFCLASKLDLQSASEHDWEFWCNMDGFKRGQTEIAVGKDKENIWWKDWVEIENRSYKERKAKTQQ